MTTEWEVPGPEGTRFSLIRHVARTGSTNADLLALAGERGAEGLVLVADRQDAGRGRQGRRWHSEPGNSALFSVLLRAPAEWASLVPLIKGLAVADGVDRLLGVEPAASPVALKWPNDVLVPARGERKLAGILSEAITVGGGLAIVAGTGINLRFRGEVPAEVAARAIALEVVAGRSLDRDEVVEVVLVALESHLRAAEVGGAEAILGPYRRRCCTLGRQVRFETPNRLVEGRATAIADNGALVVETGTGPVALTAGDAHHV